MIREGVVRTLVYLYDVHDREEQYLVQHCVTTDAQERSYHDYLELLKLYAMELATSEELTEADQRHGGVEW